MFKYMQFCGNEHARNFCEWHFICKAKLVYIAPEWLAGCLDGLLAGWLDGLLAGWLAVLTGWLLREPDSWMAWLLCARAFNIAMEHSCQRLY